MMGSRIMDLRIGGIFNATKRIRWSLAWLIETSGKLVVNGALKKTIADGVQKLIPILVVNNNTNLQLIFEGLLGTNQAHTN